MPVVDKEFGLKLQRCQHDNGNCNRQIYNSKEGEIENLSVSERNQVGQEPVAQVLCITQQTVCY